MVVDSRAAPRPARARRPLRARALATAVILVILIATAAASGQQQAQQPPRRPTPRLPRDPLQWRYARGGDTEPARDDARFWDRALLRRSLGAAGLAQAAPLLAKLNAGLPITVAAVGSSVVQDHGGTFHSSLEVLRTAVASPHPYIYGGASGPPGPAWVQSGWLTNFMRAVNATWPHRDHLLVNAGNGGATPTAIADGQCVELSLPNEADLIIIENMGMVDAAVAERITWRLIEHYTGRFHGSSSSSSSSSQNSPNLPAGTAQQRPAVILFNTAYVAAAPWDCYYSWVPDCCVNFTAAAGADIRGGKGDAPLNELADYYGITSISHRSVLWAMQRDRYAQRMGLEHGDCELASKLHRDFVHPTGELGSVLFADYLVHYLSEAEQELFGGTGSCPTDGITSARSNNNGRGSDSSGGLGQSEGGSSLSCPACPPPLPGGGVAALPAEALRPEGRDVYLMRCYGSSSAANNFLPGRTDTGDYRAAVVSLRVVASTGFVFREHQMHGNTRRLKPGWIATKLGSFLEVEVDADFSSGSASTGTTTTPSSSGSSSSDKSGHGGSSGSSSGTENGKGGDSGEDGGAPPPRPLPRRARSRLFWAEGPLAGAMGQLAGRLAGGAVGDEEALGVARRGRRRAQQRLLQQQEHQQQQGEDTVFPPTWAPTSSGTGSDPLAAVSSPPPIPRLPQASASPLAVAAAAVRTTIEAEAAAGSAPLPTDSSTDAPEAEAVIAYLTSYEHMGRARLSCRGGCSCTSLEVDGHHKQHTSVSAAALLPLRPVQSAGGLSKCVVRIEVLPGTSSGEHKFKLIQVVARAKAPAAVAVAGSSSAAAADGAAATAAAAAAVPGPASGGGPSTARLRLRRRL